MAVTHKQKAPGKEQIDQICKRVEALSLKLASNDATTEIIREIREIQIALKDLGILFIEAHLRHCLESKKSSVTNEKEVLELVALLTH